MDLIIYKQVKSGQAGLPGGLKNKIETIKKAWLASSYLFRHPILHFQSSSSRLSKKAEGILEKLAVILAKEKENWGRLTLFGYTDATGNAKLNAKLANKRAKKAGSILEKGGIAASRMDLMGVTAAHREVITPAAKAEDRRVEVEINGIMDGTKLKQQLDALKSSP